MNRAERRRRRRDCRRNGHQSKIHPNGLHWCVWCDTVLPPEKPIRTEGT